MLWQENALAETTVSVNTTLKPVVENLEKHVLFVDNLTAQQTDDLVYRNNSTFQRKNRKIESSV